MEKDQMILKSNQKWKAWYRYINVISNKWAASVQC